MLLAGDVGGTKTLLGLFERRGGRLRCLREASFPSQASPSFEAIVERFLSAGKERVRAATVGVAGPVVGGVSQVVNLHWPVDERKLARVVGAPQASLLNDLEATAWGVSELPPARSASLTPGLRPGPGNAALIAAGTGLGMALIVRSGARPQPMASEGGHQAFGPRDDLELDLLRYLRRRHGRVSVERVVSGPGLGAIYDFLRDSGRAGESRAMSRRLAESGDRNAAISTAALAGESRLARMALERFVSAYGSAAGDLALVARATGGIWVGGGIAPRILDSLRTGEFVRAFRAKGRLSAFVARIPIRVILEPRTALIGAAAHAERISEQADPGRSKR